MTLLRTAVLSIGAAFLLGVTTANAGAIPRYDVEGYCKNVAQVSGGSNMIFNSCMDMEQVAYDGLKTSWSDIPNKTTRYCDEVARSIGGSYEILLGCIDQEMQAAGTKKGFQY